VIHVVGHLRQGRRVAERSARGSVSDSAGEGHGLRRHGRQRSRPRGRAAARGAPHDTPAARRPFTTWKRRRRPPPARRGDRREAASSSRRQRRNAARSETLHDARVLGPDTRQAHEGNRRPAGRPSRQDELISWKSACRACRATRSRARMRSDLGMTDTYIVALSG